jgi:hypothetical protein
MSKASLSTASLRKPFTLLRDTETQEKKREHGHDLKGKEAGADRRERERERGKSSKTHRHEHESSSSKTRPPSSSSTSSRSSSSTTQASPSSRPPGRSHHSGSGHKQSKQSTRSSQKKLNPQTKQENTHRKRTSSTSSRSIRDGKEKTQIKALQAFKREFHMYTWLPEEKRYVPTGQFYQNKNITKCAQKAISQGFRQFVLLEFDKTVDPHRFEPIKSVAAYFYVGLPISMKEKVVKIKNAEFIKDKKIILVQWHRHIAKTSNILDILTRYRPPDLPKGPR